MLMARSTRFGPGQGWSRGAGRSCFGQQITHYWHTFCLASTVLKHENAVACLFLDSVSLVAKHQEVYPAANNFGAALFKIGCQLNNAMLA